MYLPIGKKMSYMGYVGLVYYPSYYIKNCKSAPSTIFVRQLMEKQFTNFDRKFADSNRNLG